MSPGTLRRRLATHIGVRLIVATVLLGAALVVQWRAPGRLPVTPFFYLIALTYAMSLGFIASLRFVNRVPGLIEVHFAIDAAIISAGVFLTGGVDVCPTNYGEPRHKDCDAADPARDWTEILLIRWSLADKKPVLGVCRGIQAINVACGGSLHQHLPEHMPAMKHDWFPLPGNGLTRDYLAHEVAVAAGSHLGRLMGEDRPSVNSMHHQGIKKLGRGLIPSATAPDGLVEGLEGSEGFLVAVQWHPEELSDTQPGMKRLFSTFVDAAKA